MSNTLDRLKELNSKLEAKLSQKQGKSGGSSKPESLMDLMDDSGQGKEETGEQKPTASPTAAKSRSTKPRRTAQAKKSTSNASAPSDIAQSMAGETAEIGRSLLLHLGIDETHEPVRAQNLMRLAELYVALGIDKKVEKVKDLFIYKAMNISGIGLKEEDFGEIREGKYVQVIAITYEPDKNGKKKAKNISLGYFGKAEALDPLKKNQVIEFVLRWRYEKAFQNLEHYRLLLERVRPKERLF